MIRLHKCKHVFHLVPSSSHQNHTFKGTFERPGYTDTTLCATKLYNEGYGLASDLSPRHVSSRNHTKRLDPTLK
jgi:hypothetical protein